MANPLIRRKEKSYAIPLPNQSAGILDDHAIRKNIATKEGTIEHTPINSNHITNKAYVDAEIASINFWQRVGTVLSPLTAGDDITTTGDITGDALNSTTLEVGTTPSFGSSRKIKIHDDGVQFDARLTFIGTGNTAYPSLEFITDGDTNKRTLIRHDVGSVSTSFDLNFFTTNFGTVRSVLKLTGNGDLEFQQDNQGIVWGSGRDYKMREKDGDLELRYLSGTGDFLINDMDVILEHDITAANGLFIDNLTGGKLVNTKGRIKNTTRLTTTYTILITDDVVFANTDSAAYTVTLPVGAEGQSLRIINSGSSSNILTVAPNGSEHLLGSNTSFTLNDAETLELVYNATDGWY